MLVVHKFPLRTTDRQEIYLPVSAKVLTVQVQHGTPCLWALVDEDADLTKHSLTIVGTGHPVGMLSSASVPPWTPANCPRSVLMLRPSLLGSLPRFCYCRDAFDERTTGSHAI